MLLTEMLFLLRNNMEQKAPREGDIFDFIRGFEKLAYLFVEGNGLTSIPSDAFQNLPLLGSIILRGNNIRQIGDRAFATNPDELIVIQNIDLSNNYISSWGLNENAFEGLSSTARVDLECNKMNFMEQKSFQTLLDRANAVYVGCQDCPGDGSPCTPVEFLACDERADWICDQRGKYQPKLVGFYCHPGTGANDIWEYCEGRNGTIAK